MYSELNWNRDSRSKVVYHPISASSFSHRHSISVKWSHSQDYLDRIDMGDMEFTSVSREFRASMVSVACTDKVQSESYISVFALFLIFSPSPKEEKVYLRLPTTWRELWFEFEKTKQTQIDALHRSELREIRRIVQSHYKIPTTIGRGQQQTLSKPNGDSALQPPSQRPALLQNSEVAAREWQTRAASSAYEIMLQHRRTLPIWQYKDEMMDVVDSNQIIIVCGETGCGKSTQVPAFLLEHALSQARPCKIYCTEPRRISALSLARRVSEELGERKHEVGTSRSLVGYAIRLESQITPHTRLIYATTGIVLRMLERGDELEGITHVIVDEVHERNIDSDFLLIVLKRLMVKRPELRVILMSATVDAEQFAAFFGGIPIVNIPGRTYPVETRFLEDAIEETQYGASQASGNRQAEEIPEESEDSPDETKPALNSLDLSSYSTTTRNTLKQWNEYRIDYDFIVQLLEAIAKKPKYAHYSKAILVFLPGMGEIRRLNDMLVGHPTFFRGWQIFPLHSTISTEEQERAFVVPPKGIRKIVLATNIAETGITIPDVTCVVDTGKHKEMRFDERRQLSRLIESFISRANAKQRRGRAGRVQEGLCFHLFTRQRHDLIISDAQTPEILRLSLQDLALRIKICKLGEVEQVLSEALSPPLAKNVRRAIDSLIEVRALTAEQNLTLLGRQLATLPLDVYLGKLILLSSIFRCLDAGLTIAACLSSKSPFSAPVNARSQADQARLGFKKGDSDLLTVYNAYCAWRRICQTSGSSEYHFCRKNYLIPQTMSSIEDLKAQLASALVESGFLQLDAAGKASLNSVRSSSRQRQFLELPATSSTNSTNTDVVNTVIAWSFYPKLLIREGNGFRNVANNQSVGIYPASVNKGARPLPQFLSYYHIMQASSRAYHAHETSVVEDFSVALSCGEGDFKLYSGVMSIDGNRVKFALSDWKAMLVLRAMRESVRNIVSNTMQSPTEPLSETDQAWFDLWQDIFVKRSEDRKQTASTLGR